MSENPYQSLPNTPSPASASVSAVEQKPGGLTAIAVICLILGVLGGLGAILGLIMLPFQESFNQLQSGQPGADFQAKMAGIQKTQFIPAVIVNGSNLIVGTLLVIGSIGVLKLKESGRNLLRSALLVATVFVVLRGIYGMWVQYYMMGVMREMLQGQTGDADAVMIGMQVGIVVGVVIGLAFLVGLSAFYLWSRMYLNKPPIRALFDAAS